MVNLKNNLTKPRKVAVSLILAILVLFVSFWALELLAFTSTSSQVLYFIAFPYGLAHTFGYGFGGYLAFYLTLIVEGVIFFSIFYLLLSYFTRKKRRF